MALEGEILNDSLKTTFPAGYVRVVRVEFFNEDKRCIVDASLFANKEASESAKRGEAREVEMFRFRFDVPTGEVNPFAYAYQELRKMPGLENVEDV